MTTRTRFAQLRQAVIDAWIECCLNDGEKQELLDFIEELKEKVGFYNAE